MSGRANAYTHIKLADMRELVCVGRHTYDQHSVNTIGSSGSSALSLAGQFDWGGPGLVEDSGPIGCPTGPVGDPIGPVRGPTGPVGGPTGNEAKDQMIGWLLGMGADITLMDPNDAEAYLDR